VLAYRDVGIELKDLTGYTRHPWRDGLVSALRENFKSVEEKPQPGDVLLFSDD
jgi:cell wall-associated NlpC family hydrolase